MNNSIPSITDEEARAALALVEQTAQRLRWALGESALADYLLIWGGVWLVGFLSSAWFPRWESLVWTVADGLGLLASLVTSWRYAHRVRSLQYAAFGRQIGAFWLGLLGYGALIVWVAHPTSSEQMGLLISLIAMFGYWVMGIWTRSRFLTGASLGVTATMLIGHFLLPQWFDLWMAVLGGGGLLAAGYYLRRGQRR